MTKIPNESKKLDEVSRRLKFIESEAWRIIQKYRAIKCLNRLVGIEEELQEIENEIPRHLYDPEIFQENIKVIENFLDEIKIMKYSIPQYQ